MIGCTGSATGVFKVGLALCGKQGLGLAQYQITQPFTQCNLVESMVQGLLFRLRINSETAPWFRASAWSS